MDTGEVWSFRYDALLRGLRHQTGAAAGRTSDEPRDRPRLRDSMIAVHAASRTPVADFRNLGRGAIASAACTDQILRMTRAEIGNHLGMTLETVEPRAVRLARTADVIRFAEKGRREIQIPKRRRAQAFIRGCVALAGFRRRGGRCTEPASVLARRRRAIAQPSPAQV